MAMKTTIFTLILFLGFSTQINAQDKLMINRDKSNLHWYGYYTFYFGGHDGGIQFKDGYFIKTGAKITGGEFVIDMNSISNYDIDKQEGKDSLVDHLKDPDFF